jgi:hypothetical protein
VAAALLLAAALTVVLVRRGGEPAHVPVAAEPPLAAGDTAANIPLDSSRKRVLLRWVASDSGRLRRLYVRVKVEGSRCWAGRPGYAAGSGGVAEAIVYRTRSDGRPDVSRELARATVRPCSVQHGESLGFPLSLDVTAGEELATVVDNGDPHPTRNWFSLNFLYEHAGLVGPNSRNDRDPEAAGPAYGLDPRELVGYSSDAGRTWQLPGGPYGPSGGRAFLPTYIAEYADGRRDGQPYYYGHPLEGTVVMVFPHVRASWTINEIGTYVSAASSSKVSLAVDGRERAQVTLQGRGMLREPVGPVQVEAGSTVTLTARAGSGGLALDGLHADAVWTALMDLGDNHRFYLRSQPELAAPLYPLPFPSTS